MIFQPYNPSNEERHRQLALALKELKREEDLEYILRYTAPPQPITSILPPGSLKGKKIGVIGAGCAGLASSYELRKLGCDITIFEANPTRIGGRIYTYFFSDEYYGELGPMRIPVSHETSWHYINEFKLDTNPFLQNSENNILYAKNRRFYGLDIDEEVSKYLYPVFNIPKEEQQIPFSQLIYYVYNQAILNLPVEMRPLIIAIRENYPDQINFYNNIDFRQMCDYLGLSKYMIDLINSIIGADRGFFYFNYLEILKEAYPASFIYLYEITGGLYKLPHAFYDALKIKKAPLGNVDLKLGQRLIGMYDLGNQVKIRNLDLKNNTIFESTFDYIICTIPFSSLRLVDTDPLFSQFKMAAIKEVNYSPSQKTLILFKERFWERKINGKVILGGRLITDLPIISAWFPSHTFNDHYGVLMASYNMNLDTTRLTNVDPNFTIFEILRQLEMALGFSYGYLDDLIIDYKIMNWNKNDYSLGAFVKYYTQQNELFAYPSYVPEYQNKIYFAGEHVGPLHGWMQSALQSAMVSANLLAKWEKKKRGLT